MSKSYDASTFFLYAISMCLNKAGAAKMFVMVSWSCFNILGMIMHEQIRNYPRNWFVIIKYDAGRSTPNPSHILAPNSKSCPYLKMLLSDHQQRFLYTNGGLHLLFTLTEGVGQK